jgi:hypothetical protein
MADRTDDRIRKDLSVARGSRAAEDRRLTEDRTLTDDERLDMFRRELYNDALPNLPEIPGYHCCWLTTNYQGGDTIHKRMRLGYELIRAEEVPGFDHISIKTGEYAGCIGVNEMVAAKISERLYRGYMRISHHEQPKEAVAALNARIDGFKDEAEREGGRITTDVGDGIDGLQELRRDSAPVPEDFV